MPDESFMPWYIDQPAALAVGKVNVRESQFDGDPTGFFFFEPVCCDSSESSDERAFTVVNVACGTDDDHGRKPLIVLCLGLNCYADLQRSERFLSRMHLSCLMPKLSALYAVVDGITTGQVSTRVDFKRDKNVPQR